MQLSLQNFTALVTNSAAAVQGACAQLLDLTVGSVLRAVLEANASLALWLQWLILQVLSITRAATSSGTDLDSWYADFSFVRLPAVAATGAVTFSRLSVTTSALIQPGATVKTVDGSQSFAVTQDSTNPLWNATLNGYFLAAGVTSATVPVAAVTAGVGGNVQPGTITLIASAIPSIDNVTNALAFFNGEDAEADSVFRGRFVLYIAGLSKATEAAIDAAVAGVQDGIKYAIAENVSTVGAYQPGNFVVTIDDGTGSPPASLIALVAAAVNLVRPVTVTFAVQPPAVTVINVNLTLTVAAGYTKASLIGPVATAIEAYIAALPIGATVPYTRLAQIAYDTSPGITNVSALTLNGGTTDLVLPGNGSAIVGAVTVG